MTTKKRDLRVHGIVLAGVHSWGESALERVCSRPLLPVAGRPLIWHVLQWLHSGGVPQATICANSDTRMFRGCMGRGDGLGMQLDYYEDAMPRGPAGCMQDAAARSDADVFVVVDGTIVTQADLDAILQAHERLGADLTVGVAKTSHRGGGMASGLEPVGIYAASRQVFDFICPHGYQDIKEMLIPALYRQGQRVVPYAVPEGSSLRVTGVASYLAANGWVAEQTVLRADPPAGYSRHGDACIHDSARVASSACLAGPVVIGPKCTIADNVTIVGPTSIGAGSRIEKDVVIRRAAIWSHCLVGAGAILDDTILIDGAVVEPAAVMRDAVWGLGETRVRAAPGDTPANYWGLPAPDPGLRTDDGWIEAGADVSAGNTSLAG